MKFTPRVMLTNSLTNLSKQSLTRRLVRMELKAEETPQKTATIASRIVFQAQSKEKKMVVENSKSAKSQMTLIMMRKRC